MLPAIFERYVSPARSKPQLWRIFVGIIVITATYAAGFAVLFAAIWFIFGDKAVHVAQGFATVETPTGALLLLATFSGMALGPILAARIVHGRGIATLIGRSSIALRDFAIAAAVVLSIYAILTLGWSFQYDAIPNLDPKIWLAILPLSLVALLIQTGAEELVFRGYLMQQLAARFSSPVIWMVLPSVTFGLMHYDPTNAGDAVWLAVIAATTFGFVAADLTRATGSLGAAWGFHFANNMVAILFISVDGTIPGLALYLTPYSTSDLAGMPILLVSDAIAMVFAWSLLRRILQR